MSGFGSTCEVGIGRMVLLAATKRSVVGWCVGLVAALIMASARPPGGGAEPTVLAEHVL